MNLHTIGIIGAGMYGKVLLRWLQQSGRARVTWVTSASEVTARAAAQEFNVPNWTTDYRVLLADPELDAVVIATPPYLHEEHFRAAVAAGKHVLLEKPLAESPASLDKIVETARQAQGRVILEASCRHTRLTRKFQSIKNLLDAGRLGEIYHIHHTHLTRETFIEWNPDGAWAMNKALAGGGPFVDWGVYDLSFHLGLLDDRPELLALRRFTRGGLRDMRKWTENCDIEQHGAAWMEFSGGLTYYYERGAGVHAESPNETRIFGTRGSLRVQYTSWDSPEIEFFSVENDELRRETFTVTETEDDSQRLVGHFLDCLDGAAQPLMTVETAARHMRILFQIINQP